jgi:hypothetical protein
MHSSLVKKLAACPPKKSGYTPRQRPNWRQFTTPASPITIPITSAPPTAGCGYGRIMRAAERTLTRRNCLNGQANPSPHQPYELPSKSCVGNRFRSLFSEVSPMIMLERSKMPSVVWCTIYSSLRGSWALTNSPPRNDRHLKRSFLKQASCLI